MNLFEISENIAMAAAFEALKDRTLPNIGIVTMRSQSSRTSEFSPQASSPITIIGGLSVCQLN